MPDYEPRIDNSELLRCMLALCLDEENIYRRLYRNLKGTDKEFLKRELVKHATKGNGKGHNHETKLIFGLTPNTLANTVLLPSKAAVNRSSLTSLVDATTQFRKVYLTLFPDSELRHLHPLVWDDFDPEIIHNSSREQRLYSFGTKLGYCKRSGENGSLVLNVGEVEADKMAIIKAVDRKKNTANKPGCGVNIDRPFAQKIFERYEGVYALYYPAGYRHDGEQGYFRAAMRVSHTLEQGNLDCSVIRAKLNIPNVSCEAARYQYRGYLTPIGKKDHLQLMFYLATNTINREDCLSKASPLDLDTINIICTRMVEKEAIFRGILTSLSQREEGYSRLPFASKVLIKHQRFNGSPQQVHDAEGRFMRSDGLGYFETLRDMLTTIHGRSECAAVENYFKEANNKPSLIYSESLF